MALVDGNQVVEALPAGCPHPAFGDRVRGGRPNRGPQTLDSQAGRALSEVGAPDPVMVMDQISRLAVPRRCFDQLPPDPRGAGMGGCLEMDELATPMTVEEDDEERLKGKSLDDEEVSGPDRLSMVGKEGAPALAGRLRRARPAVAADQARTDHDAELEQLAPDALPQSGFSLAIVAISSRTSGLNRGRPS